MTGNSVPSARGWRRLSHPLALLGLWSALWLAPADPSLAQALSPEALNGVVEVEAVIPGDARTADTLGTERQGSGVVIDDDGLILTIGYLILEASEVTVRGPGPDPVPAEIVAYDHETGFGLLRAKGPLGAAPVPLGDSAGLSPMQPLLVVSRTGALEAAGVYLVDRRDFAGYWEYLLEDAIFTSPPHAAFGGAALVDAEARLVGIGSLFVPDAGLREGPLPGNMFVPVDQLKPIMADLLASGRRADPPRPWLGVTLEEHRGYVFVTRVAPDSPAASAGVRSDDLILGVGGIPVGGLSDFYRKLWGLGEAGVEVPLELLQGMQPRALSIRSGNRYRYLKLNPTY